MNAWTHLAVTHDGSSLRLFVNGIQVRSITAPAIAPSAGSLRFGGNSLWLDEYYRGLIDEIRIYNRALTAAEIQADMVTPIYLDRGRPLGAAGGTRLSVPPAGTARSFSEIP